MENRDLLHFIAEQQGEIVWYKELSENTLQDLHIPISDLRMGTVHTTVFNSQGAPLCHRAVYLNKRGMTINLKTDQVEYVPREKVTMHVDVLDPAGDMKVADMSISVTDANINPDWNDNTDMYTYAMLFDGMVKPPFPPGFIMQQASDPIGIVDIYMMTIGGQKINWPSVLGTEGDPEEYLAKAGFLNQVLDVHRLDFIESSLARIETMQFFNRYILKYNQVFPEYYMINKRYLSTNKPAKTRMSQSEKIRDMLESGVPVLDVIRSIKNYQLMGNKIVFFGPNSLLNQDGALIVMDGIKLGTDAGILKGLNPIDIDDIRVITDPTEVLMYTGLNNVGIIEIKSKSGQSEKEEQPENIRYNPTLYWNPFVYSLQDRRISLSFESTIVKSSYIVVVQGFTENGDILYEAKSFSVY
jgi:hypothetical protein